MTFKWYAHCAAYICSDCVFGCIYSSPVRIYNFMQTCICGWTSACVFLFMLINCVYVSGSVYVCVLFHNFRDTAGVSWRKFANWLTRSFILEPIYDQPSSAQCHTNILLVCALCIFRGPFCLAVCVLYRVIGRKLRNCIQLLLRCSSII